jgi:putative oxidoreductase
LYCSYCTYDHNHTARYFICVTFYCKIKNMKHYHIVSRIAIYMLAIVMIIFGVFYFLNPHDLLLFVPDFVPGGILWVYATGTAFILVGLAFIFNKMVKLAGYLLAGILLVFVLFIHLPNYLYAGDKELQLAALINMLKDTAIAGFALHLAAGAYHQHLHLENSD